MYEGGGEGVGICKSKFEVPTSSNHQPLPTLQRRRAPRSVRRFEQRHPGPVLVDTGADGKELLEGAVAPYSLRTADSLRTF